MKRLDRNQRACEIATSWTSPVRKAAAEPAQAPVEPPGTP